MICYDELVLAIEESRAWMVLDLSLRPGYLEIWRELNSKQKLRGRALEIEASLLRWKTVETISGHVARDDTAGVQECLEELVGVSKQLVWDLLNSEERDYITKLLSRRN